MARSKLCKRCAKSPRSSEAGGLWSVNPDLRGRRLSWLTMTSSAWVLLVGRRDEIAARLCDSTFEEGPCATVRHSKRTVAMATATAKLTTTVEINDIQRRMALVRHEMHHDVREAVKGARSLTDWRSLVQTHPWLTLAAAAATGYLIVPKRRSEPPATVMVGVPTTPPASPTSVNLASAPREKSWSLIGSVLGLLAPIAIRAAQNYAVQYLEQRLAPQPVGRASEMRRGGGAGFGTAASPTPNSPREPR